ncbi:PEGA domain-containing protein [Candidatus Saccharibacteria bacterium]|nr:PEGA domain-containing protein [Candidatus Saccharibacteria bacterium]MCB9834837.1 PEGA domain-containing protein [Candidatus Nomurabacteria bacterium]
MPIPKKDLLLLFVGSILLTILTSLGFLYSLGYRLDRSNLSLVRSAIMMIESYPREASIYLDNKLIKQDTNAELKDLDPGIVEVRVEKPGYQVWQKSIDLVEGLVEFVDYVILAPEKPELEDFELVVNDSENYQLIDYKISSDRLNSLALSKSSDDYHLSYYNHDRADSLENPQLLVVKEDQIIQTKLYPKLEIVKVGEDKNAILKATNTKEEAYWLYYNGSDLINLDSTMSIREGELVLVPNQPEKLVWIKGTELRILNLRDKTIGPVVTNKLFDYQVSSGQINLLTLDKERLSLSQLDQNNASLIPLLDDLESDPNIQVESIDYRGQSSIAILYPVSQKLVWYQDYKTKLKTELLSSQATALRLSPDNRYLLWQDSAGWNSFDLLYPDSSIEVSSESLDPELVWFDSRHLISNQASLKLLDFDGTNSMSLSEQIDSPIIFDLENKDLIMVNLKTKLFKKLNLIPR